MPELLALFEDFSQIGNIKELMIAFIIALPIGWNREKESRSMGLRTFPLVAIASCGYMLIGSSIVSGDPDALSKLLYGLMTGIGFIGGGAILKMALAFTVQQRLRVSGIQARLAQPWHFSAMRLQSCWR